MKNLKINSLDFLKIDTQGAELEILKGLGFYKPLLIKCEVQIHSIYKNTPPWTELLNFLNKLNYIVCDWRTIGSHVTRTPVEMDMVFVPNFLKDEGKTIININLVNENKILKFRLKNARKLDRKSLNLLRNQEIQAIIN